MLQSVNQSIPSRQWRAELNLGLASRPNKTVLVNNTHFGPLRVQRPFYPEYNDCAHIYLLHPPGGMVLGDRLHINVHLAQGANALLTTPSAGKIYGVQKGAEEQVQVVDLYVEDGACLEWLPQETIAFNGANGRLTTRLKLQEHAKACVWDIVCLGRPASNDLFEQGRCDQILEIWKNDKLLLLEKNRFEGGSALLAAPWGLRGANTSGTFCALVSPSRECVDDLLEKVNALSSDCSHQWGITQKGELLIVRYIGASASLCRKSFELIWGLVRPQLNQREAVTPRIWNT